MRNPYERIELELRIRRETMREIDEEVSRIIDFWIASVEESAKSNQPYNHQILHKIKKELREFFEKEIQKLNY